MDTELQEMIREARQELRKASGPLSSEEQEQERRNVEVDKLLRELLPKLGVRLNLNLLGTSIWTPKGAAIVLKSEDQVFQLRKAPETGKYQFFVIEGDGEREIVQLVGTTSSWRVVFWWRSMMLHSEGMP